MMRANFSEIKASDEESQHCNDDLFVATTLTLCFLPDCYQK